MSAGVSGIIATPLKIWIYPTFALSLIGGASMGAAWSGTASEGAGVTIGVVSEDASTIPAAIDRGKSAAATGGGPE